MLKEEQVSCKTLLLPGDCRPNRLQAQTIITYGLSATDTLTLSSLEQPVLCVQRALPCCGGHVIEPQEFPLPGLPGSAQALLPLLGLSLLLRGNPRFWQEKKSGNIP